MVVRGRIVPLLIALAVAICHSPQTAKAASMHFGYDPAGRLVTGMFDTSCVLYGYDANGNRTSQQKKTLPVSTPVWGGATWGSENWATGALVPVWGSASWGCLNWVAE